MILEYLFLDKTHRAEIEKYKYHYDVNHNGKITRTIEIVGIISELDKNECWILKFEMATNGEEAAKHLSKINDLIVKKYNPVVLKNESSVYFNKVLYPLVNTFERELRKFLYLKSALYEGEEKKNILGKLESLNFGGIYRLLYIDDNFCNKVRKKVISDEENKLAIFNKRNYKMG